MGPSRIQGASMRSWPREATKVIFADAALLICLVLGLSTVTPVRMIVGIAAGLGGLVLMGSSVGSTEQLERSLKQTEAERNAAIDSLEFVDLGAG